MSALARIPVPLWSPPRVGPWRIRAARPDGSLGGLTVSRFDDKAEAERWAAAAQRACREGCTYDVVPDA